MVTVAALIGEEAGAAGGGVLSHQVKERMDVWRETASLPNRKCQAFAMCGTGSDSKAGSTSAEARNGRQQSLSDLRKATKNVATEAYW